MSEKFQVALDLSGQAARLAVLGDGVVKCDLAKPMKGRDAAGFAAWVEDNLQAAGTSLEGVSLWTVGAGPGSFTGMRIAAALTLGWSFGRSDMQSRCVPSAVALAAAEPQPEGVHQGVLYDGRNHELIWYPVVWQEGEPRPAGGETVLNEATAQAFFAAATQMPLVAQSGDREALEKLLSREVAARVRWVDQYSAVPLVRAKYQPFDDDLSQLVYIRPAYFPPKEK